MARTHSYARFRFARPLRLELLERRDQPSASWLSALAQPLIDSATVSPFAGRGSFSGLTPAIVRQAYGINQIDFGNGQLADGSGQTIAIITAYNPVNINRDTAVFNRTFGLPDVPSLSTYVANGAHAADASWSLETALDVQWAHAIAPGANIMVVGARSSQLGDMIQAVNFARQQPEVSVVSMSWGAREFASQRMLDYMFTTPIGHEGVSFVAASGDFGAAAGPMWPAASPNVLAVGGTSLTTDNAGNYRAETAWSGSGGGISQFVRGGRAIPDVSYAAAPNNGFMVYSTTPDAQGQSGWYLVGGTSAGAPQWSAIVAIANQGREAAGQNTLTDARAAVLGLTDSAFRDVTSGSNGYSAGLGFDLATGKGTPDADLVVSQLVNRAGPAIQQFVGPVAPKSTSTATTPVPSVNGRSDLPTVLIAAIAAQDRTVRPVFNSAIAAVQQNNRFTSQFDPRQFEPDGAAVLAPKTRRISEPDLSEKVGGGEEQNIVDGGAPGEAKPDAAPAGPLGHLTPSAPIVVAVDNVVGSGESMPIVAGNGPAGTTDSPAVGENSAPKLSLSFAALAALLAGGFLRTPQQSSPSDRRRWNIRRSA